MAEMLRKEIQDLLMNQDFTKGLLELEDESKVKNYFSVNGKVDLTDDEVTQVKQSVKGVMDKVAEVEVDKISGGGHKHHKHHKRHKNADDVYGEFADDAKNPWEGADWDGGNVDVYLPEEKLEDNKGILDKFNELSPVSKGLVIGVPVAAAVAGVGTGIYALGRKKGWWSK